MGKIELVMLDRYCDFEQIGKTWTELNHSKSSYFLSWGWVEHWLSTLPKELELKLAVVKKNGVPVLAFFLGIRKIVRHKILKSQTFFLNATGEEAFDQLCIEYNSILSRSDTHVSLNELLELLPVGWEEFRLPGMNVDEFPGNSLNQRISSNVVIIEKSTASPYVDLEAVRQSSGGYLSLLSSNTRYQINRSYRGYNKKLGTMTCEVATHLEQAYNIYTEMIELHQKCWQSRGELGAFASDYFRSFHRDLIRKRFDSGEIQLIKISCGQQTIGCLYSFVQNGQVSFYQSGFNYSADQHLKPGMISFTEAIKYNASQGHMTFDFLGGDSTYKARLSTHSNRLVWACIQKPLVKFRLESTLRCFKKILFGPKQILPTNIGDKHER